MAIALKGTPLYGSGSTNSSGVIDIDVSSLSLASADLVIVSFCGGQTSDLAAPTCVGNVSGSFTIEADMYANDSQDVNGWVWTKIVQGNDTTITVDCPTTTFNVSYSVRVYTGVHGGVPLDVAVTTAIGGNSDRPVPAAITPTSSGAKIVAVYFGRQQTVATAWTAPGGNIGNWNQVSGGAAYGRLGVGDADWTSGAFTPTAVTAGGNNNAAESWAAVTLALAPETSTYRLLTAVAPYTVTYVDALVESSGIELIGHMVNSHSSTSSGAVSNFNTQLNPPGSTSATGVVLRENDYAVVACVASDNSNRSTQMNSRFETDFGYTRLFNAVVSTDSFVTTLGVYGKFMTSTPDTACPLPPCSSTDFVSAISFKVFRNVSLTNPIDVTPTTASGINTATANPPSITPSTARSWVCGVGATAMDPAASSVLTNPGDYDSDVGFYRAVQRNGVSGVQRGCVAFGVKTDWTSGAVDFAAFGGGGAQTTDSWAAAAFVLRAKTLPKTLIASSQSYTYTGPAGNKLTAARKLPITTRTYAFTGPAGNRLLYARKMVNPVRTYTYTGPAGNRLLYGHRLPITAQSYTYTGPAGNKLTYARKIIATQATYVATGPAGNRLLYARKMPITSATYTLTGPAGNQLVRGRIFTATQASYAFTGVNNRLLYARKIPIVSASYTLTGPAGNRLLYARKMPITTRTYAFTGIANRLLKGVRLPATTQSYVFTGPAGNRILYGRKVPITSATYVYTTIDNQMRTGKGIVATTRTFTFTSPDTGMRVTRKLPVTAQPYIFTGIDAIIQKGRTLNTQTQDYTISSASVSMQYGRKMSGEAQTYEVTGVNVNMFTGVGIQERVQIIIF